MTIKLGFTLAAVGVGSLYGAQYVPDERAQKALVVGGWASLGAGAYFLLTGLAAAGKSLVEGEGLVGAVADLVTGGEKKLQEESRDYELSLANKPVARNLKLIAGELIEPSDGGSSQRGYLGDTIQYRCRVENWGTGSQSFVLDLALSEDFAVGTTETRRVSLGTLTLGGMTGRLISGNLPVTNEGSFQLFAPLSTLRLEMDGHRLSQVTFRRS